LPIIAATVASVRICGEHGKLFLDILADTRPHAIIFMVDHLNRSSHEDAWSWLCTLLTETGVFHGRSKRARRRLSAVLLLINKSDEWRPEFGKEGATNPYHKNVADMKLALWADKGRRMKLILPGGTRRKVIIEAEPSTPEEWERYAEHVFQLAQAAARRRRFVSFTTLALSEADSSRLVVLAKLPGG